MSDPAYRYNQDFTQTTPKTWIRKWGSFKDLDGGSEIHTVQFGADIGIAAVNPRWPSHPNDDAGYLVYVSAEKTVSKITGDGNYKEYLGITLNPQFSTGTERVAEKNMKVMIPVGSEAVEYNDFLMPDIDSVLSLQATDVIPQRAIKQWVFQAHTAITAAVDNVAGYAAGTTVIQIDTISVAFALRPGQTISITTGGVAYYYLIKSINYALPTAAGTDAIITLAWGLQIAVVNNDAITTAHVASAPIYIPYDSEMHGMLKEIVNTVQFDASAADADILPVVAFAAGGIAANTVAIVPSGGFTHPGGARAGIGLQLGTVLDTGDRITLTAYFYDRIIRTFTVGKADESGTARVSTTSYSEVRTSLKS